MKQIPFNHELLNTPGIVVKYRDGSQPDFVKVYDSHIRSVTFNGDTWVHKLDGMVSPFSASRSSWDLIMYRQPRTAEEVARDVVSPTNKVPSWEDYPWQHRDFYTKLVQAGMDEAKGQD